MKYSEKERIELFKDYKFYNEEDILKYYDIYSMGCKLEYMGGDTNKNYYQIWEYNPIGLDDGYLVYIDYNDNTLRLMDGSNIVQFNIDLEVTPTIQDDNMIYRLMEDL